MSATATTYTQRDLCDRGDDPEQVRLADNHGEHNAVLTLVTKTLVAGEDPAGSVEWELVGSRIIALARRESRPWRECSSEYEGAFIAAAIELIRSRAVLLQGAHRPWGLIVCHGRLAGLTAVGADLSGGLTARDPDTHRVRYSMVPRPVSLDLLVERLDIAAAS